MWGATWRRVLSKAQLLTCSFQTSGLCQPYRQLTHLTELIKNIGTPKEQSMCEWDGVFMTPRQYFLLTDEETETQR